MSFLNGCGASLSRLQSPTRTLFYPVRTVGAGAAVHREQPSMSPDDEAHCCRDSGCIFTALKPGSALYVTLLALENSGPGQRQHGDSLP